MTRKSCLVVFILLVHRGVFSLASLNVSQSPMHLKVREGESAVITCSWDSDQTTEQIRLDWKKSNISSTEEENKTFITSVLWPNNKSQESWERTVFNLSKNEAVIKINPFTASDVGIYFCEINTEIPVRKYGQGKGTRLEERPAENTDKTEREGRDNKLKFFSLAAIAIVPVTIFILIGYFLRKRMKKIRNSVSEVRIQESFELHELNPNCNDADGNSSSSSNSVQWAISTLYESCDYFAMKHPENKIMENAE